MKHIFIFFLIVFLLCDISGCKSDYFPNSEQSAFMYPQETFTSEDIKRAMELVIDENIVVIDAVIQDIDFDGEEELLILSSWGKNEIHLFRKIQNELIEVNTFGIGMLNYIDKLVLIPCEYNGEKYYCFEFHFDNGGVMSADVVGAIKKHDDGEFYIEYLLSKGQLNYSDIAQPISKDFFRLGWSQYDVELDGVFNDITENEYNEIYNRLMNSQSTD